MSCAVNTLTLDLGPLCFRWTESADATGARLASGRRSREFAVVHCRSTP